MFIKIENFSFNDEQLSGFYVTSIDEKEVDINGVEVKFQRNRTIVMQITIDDKDIIRLLNTQKIGSLTGRYYHHTFHCLVNRHYYTSINPPFYRFNILLDLIEFTKTDSFFLDSHSKFNIEIQPTDNIIKYLKRKNNQLMPRKKLQKILIKKGINQISLQADKEFLLEQGVKTFSFSDSYILDDFVVSVKTLNVDKQIQRMFTFDNITFEDYEKKYRYLLELYSFMYQTPILIEKVYLSQDESKNVLYQSQHIDTNNLEVLQEEHPLIFNSHYNIQLVKYLDDFVLFKTSKTTLNLMLKLYFISDIYENKTSYQLNDISGFVDLFDGVFFNLKVEFEKINNSRNQKDKLDKENNLSKKIDYIIDKLEPELKNYEIDKNQKAHEILASFRNMIRHQLPFKVYDIEKIADFAKGTLRLYIIKYVLKMDINDYDMNRILKDFKIYPFVKHIYKYEEEEILIVSTYEVENYVHKDLVENTIYYQALIQHNKFKNAKPEMFVYQSSKEIGKIYIDDEDYTKRSLIFDGAIIYDNTVLKNYKEVYQNRMDHNGLIDLLNERLEIKIEKAT